MLEATDITENEELQTSTLASNNMKSITEEDEDDHINSPIKSHNQISIPNTNKNDNDIDDLYENYHPDRRDTEDVIPEKDQITYGIEVDVLKLPMVKIETCTSQVNPDDINLTNCIKVGNYFLEKLEHMNDLKHSVSYKTRNTKDYKLYTLYIIDRNMIMKH